MPNLERAGHRLGTGLHATVKPLLAWPAGGIDNAAVVFRWVGVLGLGALVAWIALSGPGEFVLTVLVLGLLAWAKGNKQPEAEPEVAAPEQRRASPAELRAWIAPRVHRLLGEQPGVFLETLIADLAADGLMSPSIRVTHFRQQLTEASIPTTDKVHIGRAVRVGIHRVDLAALDALIAATTPPPGESEPVGGSSTL